MTIRFGTHARAILMNGWRSIIPVKGKAPAVLDWASFGTTYPTSEQISAWTVSHAECGIGCVMNGRFVAVDIDVCDDRFREFGFTVKDAAREALALVSKIKALAVEALGLTDFARVGLPPKVMLFYAAGDAVPTMAGAAVEIFSAPGSKQVVIYGFHSEAVDEYQWVGSRQPLTHSIDTLSPITAKQAIDFRTEALVLCDQAGLKPQQRNPSGNTSGRVSSGVVGDYMSEVLSLIGKAWRQDPREIAVEYFRQSVDGEKHYRMVAVCGALILRRFGDDDIITALTPVYRAIVHDDPSMSRLRVCPPRIRAGMRARGTNVTTLQQLDEWFGPNWSIRNG
jgi:Bifunctional DNA primase/polymerase, N-terminal